MRERERERERDAKYFWSTIHNHDTKDVPISDSLYRRNEGLISLSDSVSQRKYQQSKVLTEPV